MKSRLGEVSLLPEALATVRIAGNSEYSVSEGEIVNAFVGQAFQPAGFEDCLMAGWKA